MMTQDAQIISKDIRFIAEHMEQGVDMAFCMVCNSIKHKTLESVFNSQFTQVILWYNIMKEITPAEKKCWDSDWPAQLSMWIVSS